METTSGLGLLECIKSNNDSNAIEILANNPTVEF
jgi:hypothetical protein